MVPAVAEDEAADRDWQQPAQPTVPAPPQQQHMSDVPLAPAEQVRRPQKTRAARWRECSGPTQDMLVPWHHRCSPHRRFRAVSIIVIFAVADFCILLSVVCRYGPCKQGAVSSGFASRESEDGTGFASAQQLKWHLW